MKPLPIGRIVALALLGGVVTFVALWQAADLESTGSRLSLSLLGASGGLIFAGMLGLVTFDRDAADHETADLADELSAEPDGTNAPR